MLSKVLPDITHARLHKYNDKVNFPGKMTVPEFIDANRELMRQIFLEIENDYPEIDRHDAKRHMAVGIKNYLVAEKMYSGR